MPPNPFGQRLNGVTRRLTVRRRKVGAIKGHPIGHGGPRAERHQTVEVESDRNQRHAGPARQTGQGHPGGAGAKRLESTRGVANAFREHANDLASGQYRFHRREGFHVASRIHACVDPSIDRNGSRAPDDGAEHVSPKQGGLGQEPDGAVSRGLHERRVEQRVRVVGHQQHGAPGKRGAGSLYTIEQRRDETRRKPDAGTSRRGLHDRHPSGYLQSAIGLARHPLTVSCD